MGRFGPVLAIANLKLYMCFMVYITVSCDGLSKDRRPR
jgi:hypothetical protein